MIQSIVRGSICRSPLSDYCTTGSPDLTKCFPPVGTCSTFPSPLDYDIRWLRSDQDPNFVGTAPDYDVWWDAVGWSNYYKTDTSRQFMQNGAANFDGTKGVGCGTLAQRPGTCVVGVAYWATDQSCSSVPSGSYGKTPTTPISGTLYICGSAGWNSGTTYTPYTYPHPLRQLAGEIYECNDGLDNDGDVDVDLSDSGCSSLTDNDETNCGDGICEGGETSVTCSPDCTSPTQELVAYYTFDENSGTTAQDSSGNNNDGTISGATWATGHSGSALSFDGLNDYINAGTNSVLDLNGAMTISAWVRPVGWSTGSIGAIVTRGAGGGTGYEFYTRQVSNSYALWDINPAVISTIGPTFGEWQHAAVVVDGSTYRFYVNGEDAGTGSWSLSPSGINPLLIGSFDGSSEFFNGSIDELRIYNYALSNAEIQDLFNSQTSTCGDVDTSGNSVVEIGELISYISSWKQGEILIGELIDAIGKWKNGC